MKLEFNYQTSALVLPGAVLSKLDTASETDLRLLLWLAAGEDRRADFDARQAAAALGSTEKEIDVSLAFWRGAGVLKVSNAHKKAAAEPSPEAQPAEAQIPVTVVTAATQYNVDGLPAYSGKELEELMLRRAELARLLKECQTVLGRVFNVSESNKMIALVDYLHLPDDYILLLCSYCKSKDKGSPAYVVTTAKALFNDEIVTTGALENYIEERERRLDFENFMRCLLGIGGRKLSAKETRFFDSWQKSGLPREVLAHAYEVSVDSTGELSLAHLNKIVENYKKEKVETLEDAEKQDGKHKEEMRRLYGGKSNKQSKGDNADFKTFEVEEFFNIAKQKGREAAAKAKGEQSDGSGK